ncbi:replication initiation protein [Desulforhopalus vacuolatus]|uniref:replication initiation protein n=1 Tax=Desulforhopalus vacuolatus TaxID=40414 RepID=UPI001963DF21|nr:replication initiation protein [Desulforhopalus vacuolatus]MBM9519381.1 replication initiation protein [Desulforhopalus vacuolatus]
MKKKQLSLFPPQIVRKSNALCRCSWSAESVWEARLVALVASKIKKSDVEFQTYEISVSEIMQNKGGCDYKIVDKATEYTMSRVIKIKNAETGGWAKYNLFSKCEYNPKKGTITVRFDPDLLPHYLQLNKKFAQYDLLEFVVLSSVYSQRLYEILKSWDDKESVEIETSELHKMLNSPVYLTKNFGKFREKALNKAKEEINRKTALKFSWEAKKKGRTFHSIIFSFVKIKEEGKSKELKEGDIYQTVKSHNGVYWKYKVAKDGTGSPIQGGMYPLSKYEIQQHIKEGNLKKIRKK